MNVIEGFRAAMRAAGLEYDGPIFDDGKLHRVKATGDHERNSWYVLHAGTPAAGAFGCWKRGVKETWCERNGQLSQEEWNRVREQWKEAEREREQSEQARHAKARRLAAWILSRSRPARTLHRYLSSKGVKVFGDLREWRDALVLPLRDDHGDLHGLQFIREDGSKRFLKGGRIAGCSFIVAEKPDGPLVACEGYATGASIHEATGLAVVCVMHAGNLKAVVETLRKLHPNREIIIAADNDTFTMVNGQPKNPGLDAAMEAARCINAKLAAPQFQDVSTKPTDFNDLHRLAGIAEVTAQIQEAQLVPVSAAPDLHAAPQRNVSKPVLTLPPEGDADTAPPPPFSLDTLPPAMALLAAGVARTARVPDRLSGACVLGIVSAAIGAGLEIQADPPPAKPLRGNLFLLVSAPTGTGKSRTFDIVAAPLLEYQERLQETWRKESGPDIQSRIKAAEAKIKRLEKDIAKSNDPAESERLRAELQFKLAERDEFIRQNVQPVILAQDATTERLTAMVEEQGEVLFSASSDCRKVVSNLLGRYTKDRGQTDESFYLAGYSGDHVRVDRGSRPPVSLRHPCLGLLWFGQPDLVDTMLDTETLTAAGYIQRLLLCHSHAEPQPIEGEPETISQSVLTHWANLVTDLLSAYHRPGVHHVLQTTADARQKFVDYHNALVKRRKLELRDVTGFVARWCENAWRLAVVLHAGLCGSDAHNHPLELETAEKAIRLSEWFSNEQLEILEKGRRAARAKDEDEVMALFDDFARHPKEPRDYVTARDVYRARITATPDAARALLDRMERDGLLVGEDITPAHGGKTTRIYRAVKNPVPG